MAGADWTQPIRTLASSLLTLEVNTIEKQNMTASKMPEVPWALHQIVQVYEFALASERSVVSNALLALATARMTLYGRGEDDLAALEAWLLQPVGTESPPTQLTNGACTFEALHWAAKRALRSLPSTVAGQGAALQAGLDTRRALLIRIGNNCLLLRQLALLIARSNPNEAPGLLDGTPDQTTKALFAEPRPALVIDTDVVVQIRKIWDVGTEQVVLQTIMQVDGDVMVRMAPVMDDARRAFYATLHRNTVDTALGQWRSLFELAGALLGQLGQRLFGR